MAADGGRQDTEPKTRTPHKDVGKKETHGSHAFPSVVSSKLRDGNRNIKPQLYTQCGFDDMLASSHVTVKSAPGHEVQSDVVRRPAIKQSQSPKT